MKTKKVFLVLSVIGLFVLGFTYFGFVDVVFKVFRKGQYVKSDLLGLGGWIKYLLESLIITAGTVVVYKIEMKRRSKD